MQHISPDTLQKETSLSLHALSHLIQSILTRIQADTYMLEQIIRLQSLPSPSATPIPSAEKSIQRCRESIQQMSSLVSSLFQFLHFQNEPYAPETELKSADEWWTDLEIDGFGVLSSATFVRESGDSANKIEMDFRLLHWTVLHVLRAVSYWKNSDSSVEVSLRQSDENTRKLMIKFTPSSEISDNHAQNPENETFLLGNFFWLAAQQGVKHLSAGELANTSHQNKQQIQITWKI